MKENKEKLKRFKVTKVQKRYKVVASKGHYEKLAIAASEIVMRNRGRQYKDGGVEYILIEVPHWTKFQGDFPKGVLHSRSELHDVRKINAVKLLDWLYENGYSAYNTVSLVKQTKSFQYLEKSIDRMFEMQ